MNTIGNIIKNIHVHIPVRLKAIKGIAKRTGTKYTLHRKNGGLKIQIKEKNKIAVTENGTLAVMSGKFTNTDTVQILKKIGNGVVSTDKTISKKYVKEKGDTDKKIRINAGHRLNVAAQKE